VTIAGKVATILSDHEVAFNVGSEKGVRSGGIATVSRVVEIRDPDTRDKLGEILVPKMRFKITIVEPLMSVGQSYESVSRESPPQEDFSSLLRRNPRVLRRVTREPTKENWSTVHLRPGDPVSIESPPPAPPDEEAPPPTEDVEQRGEAPEG
jgi:hypothetical protein